MKTKLKKDGGQIQFGWAIWEWPKVMIELNLMLSGFASC
jgi:hypothetical protein